MKRWIRWSAIAVLVIALIVMILNGYSYPWTGFADYEPPSSDYVRGKTLWDWLELLIIPLFLAGSAFYLNRSEREANLSGARLTHANLTDADLTEATMPNAILAEANLNGADLSETDLKEANLSGAIVSGEQLTKVTSLEGATMPDGTIHD
jgi:hypothetical protein